MGIKKRAQERREAAEGEFVDTHGAAAITTLSTVTLEQLRQRGEGPPFCRLGRRVVYHVPTLREWVLERMVGGAQ